MPRLTQYPLYYEIFGFGFSPFGMALELSASSSQIQDTKEYITVHTKSLNK